jgi:hypothetical protein
MSTRPTREHPDDIGPVETGSKPTETANCPPAPLLVGIAFVRATEERQHPRTTITEVAEKFSALGFSDRYPNTDIESVIKQWDDEGLIVNQKEPINHWFGFTDCDHCRAESNHSPKEFQEILETAARNFTPIKNK